jgi:hypothetical protein
MSEAIYKAAVKKAEANFERKYGTKLSQIESETANVAFTRAVVQSGVPAEALDSKADAEVAASPELFAQVVFDGRHTFADIYATFNRVLALGIKNLYQETKDISELRKELVRRLC